MAQYIFWCTMRSSTIVAATTALLSNNLLPTQAKLADRSRVIKARGSNRDRNNLAIEGGAYRGRLGLNAADEGGDDQEAPSIEESRVPQQQQQRVLKNPSEAAGEREEKEQSKLRGSSNENGDVTIYEEPEHFSRRLSSQLTGCCYTYQSYSAADMCALYGQDCESGETPSHDSGDESCEQEGLSFIGISFSVNTASGNPYSYQLCDQFPMENIIDRNYDYVMSMDEDGWLVGGGYKSFDYSGKMP